MFLSRVEAAVKLSQLADWLHGDKKQVIFRQAMSEEVQ